MKLKASDFKAMKGKYPIAMLTAYNCPIARYLEKAQIPIILVGDTVGMVEMGFDSTRDVTIEHMSYHVGAVRRGAPNTHIIGDLPFKTYDTPKSALENSKILLDSGADSIKLEGPLTEIIKHLVDSGIDVIGHTGLTPQTSDNFRQVGGKKEDRERILEESISIVESGAFLLVLEHIPYELAKEITKTVNVPTIGIGAGKQCDGQVLVTNDALGIGDYWPPFSKQFAYIGKTIEEAFSQFKQEVENKTFPNL